MRILTFVIAMMSLNVFAAEYEQKEANFTIRDRVGFDRVYYACDSVEYTVKNILEKMGARNVNADCRGGLDNTNGRFHQPAYLSVDFEAINAELDGKISVSAQDIRLRDRDSCHLYNSIVNAVKDQFEIAYLDVRRCSGLSSPARIEMTVLKETN